MVRSWVVDECAQGKRLQPALSMPESDLGLREETRVFPRKRLYMIYATHHAHPGTPAADRPRPPPDPHRMAFPLRGLLQAGRPGLEPRGPSARGLERGRLPAGIERALRGP